MKLKPIFIAIFFICAIFSLANVSAQDSNNLNSSEIQDTDNIETFTLNGENTVNYNEKTKVITENLVSFGDIVRLDDYVTINSSSIKINNISYGVTKSMNLFNLCGYVSGGTGALYVSVYDKNKSVIGTETYNVTKSGNFCVNFFDLNDDVYFYSFS